MKDKKVFEMDDFKRGIKPRESLGLGYNQVLLKAVRDELEFNSMPNNSGQFNLVYILNDTLEGMEGYLKSGGQNISILARFKEAIKILERKYKINEPI